jgi:hypothetical protein
MTATKSTALEVLSPDALAERFPGLGGGDAMEAMEANLGDEDISIFDLGRVKIPAGGGTSWEVPSLDGTDSVKDLEGVVIAVISRRSYWETSLDESGGGTPPDCASDDGVIGRGLYGAGSVLHPSGECATCPMNQWGAESGGGARRKPCSEQRLSVFLREGDILPIIVQLAPTSIAPMRRFNMDLASKRVPHYRAIIKLGLERQQKQGKPAYAVVKPSLVQVVDADAGEQLKQLGKQFVQAYQAMTSTAP